MDVNFFTFQRERTAMDMEHIVPVLLAGQRGAWLKMSILQVSVSLDATEGAAKVT